MGKLESKRHHWWPETVSRRWADTNGVAHWLSPDGKVRSAPPKNFGVIGNGHFIKLNPEPSSWDQNFEHEFQKADDQFADLINWMESLETLYDVDAPSPQERFLEQPASDARLIQFTECVVSLAVRSPRVRQSAVSLAEHLRGPLPEWKRNALIGMNMRRAQRNVSDGISCRAKFAVLVSPDREFIYGDGFFSNIHCPGEHILSPRILCPITPHIAAVIFRPLSYSGSRLVTLRLLPEETAKINQSVQVYSKSALFYRSERPAISDAFRINAYAKYEHYNNPIEQLLHSIPGIPQRDLEMYELLESVGRRPAK